MMIPQPMPVPKVNSTMLLNSRPEPTQYSPLAAALASLANVTGNPA